MGKRKAKVEATYHPSPRTILEKGDKFKATGGPFFKTEDGVVIPMSEPGPFQFIEALRVGKHRLWVRALNKHNANCLLWLGPRERSKEQPGLIKRPYRIRKLRK